MNKKEAENIKNAINMCKMRLKTIQPHLTPEKKSLNETFNKLLIEKAILRDRLLHKSPSFFSSLARKVRLSGRKELICDYFK